MDGFYAKPDAAAPTPEPERRAERIPRFGEIEDAFLAATAEGLAWRHDLPPRAWALDPARSLRRPWFASTLAALRAVLLVESPAPLAKLVRQQKRAQSGVIFSPTMFSEIKSVHFVGICGTAGEVLTGAWAAGKVVMYDAENIATNAGRRSV